MENSEGRAAGRAMTIAYLADHPEFIAALAPGIAAHWRYVLKDETVERRMEKLRGHLNKGALPIAWVAHEGGEALGTAALRSHDLEGREDLTPWLAGVFVRPEHRGRGVASALCRAVEEGAWSLGFGRLYLFTVDRHSLYARLGWRTLGPAVWRGLPSEIMVKDRAAPKPTRDPRTA